MATDGSSLPMPTAEEILEDLRSAPDTDVAFTFPPVEARSQKTSKPGDIASSSLNFMIQ